MQYPLKSYICLVLFLLNDVFSLYFYLYLLSLYFVCFLIISSCSRQKAVGATSKSNRRSTGGSVWFRAVVIVYNNRNRLALETTLYVFICQIGVMLIWQKNDMPSVECRKVVSNIFGEIEFLMEYQNLGLYAHFVLFSKFWALLFSKIF